MSGPPDPSDDAHTVASVAGRLGLPPQIRCCLFDLDGVVTRTAVQPAAVRAVGMPRAVVTSSANAEQVLTLTGLAELFDLRVDAQLAGARRLNGKPAPDTFLTGAELLGFEPKEAAVFEDALAGVQAGRAGGFGLVVGVDRAGQAEQLRANGADVVVRELTDLLEES